MVGWDNVAFISRLLGTLSQRSAFSVDFTDAVPKLAQQRVMIHGGCSAMDKLLDQRGRNFGEGGTRLDDSMALPAQDAIRQAIVFEHPQFRHAQGRIERKTVDHATADFDFKS